MPFRRPSGKAPAQLPIGAPLAEAAAGALGLALLAVESEGLDVLAGEAVIAALGAEVGAAGTDAPTVVGRLAAHDPRVGEAVAALRESGRAFDLQVQTVGGWTRLFGRTSGACAWIGVEFPAPPSIPATPAVEPPVGRPETDPEGLLETLSDGVALFDAELRLERANEAFGRLFGLEPAWLARRPHYADWLDELVARRRGPDGIDPAHFRAQELSTRARGMEASEALWRLADGTRLRLRSQPRRRGGVSLTCTDVTDALDLRSRFNQLLAVQRASLDALSEAVAVFGSDGRLRLHNAAFQALWAIPPAALSAGPRFEVIADHGLKRLPDAALWRALQVRLAETDPALREPAGGEARAADGRVIAWRAHPLPDGATLLGFSDVTGARQVEDALAERERALAAARRLEEDFVAAASRALRTPLTTVLGYAELLAADARLEAARGPLLAVREAAVELDRALQDLATLAALDAGKRRPALGEVALGALVDGALARAASRARAAAVDLTCEVAPPQALITADRAALDAALDHLIENALEHAGAARVRVLADQAHGETRLVVRDDGRGIPFDIQARLFERTPDLEARGCGLGLALVKGLVELHGGWVTVESDPGAGATFTCHLPDDPGGRREEPLV